MKAATLFPILCEGLSRISIHAAREGGDLMLIPLAFADSISIHAAREGGDLGVCDFASASGISIHAAREGGDYAYMGYTPFTTDFNPRRP